MTPEDQYNDFYCRSKKMYRRNDYVSSLNYLKQAYSIKPSEKVHKKILQLKKLLPTENVSIACDCNLKKVQGKLVIHNKYYIDETCFNRLYNYQQDGVVWLFGLFNQLKGGILADDMGLGKTAQTIFFIRELIEQKAIQTVLIVMPKSLLINWERELKSWAPNLNICTFNGNCKINVIRKLQLQGVVILTTYATVTYNFATLNNDGINKFDVLILDEGHMIKNKSTKSFGALNNLNTKFRLILTGTAMQNNLRELWVLFDFVQESQLLGAYKVFRDEFEIPINKSRNKDATDHEKLLGNRIALRLKEITRPFMLRRTKDQVNNEQLQNKQNLFKKLPPKNEFILWIQLSKLQNLFYRKFLQLDSIKYLLLGTDKRSPLVELNILKKICDHPRLLPSSYSEAMGISLNDRLNIVNHEDLLKESAKTYALWILLKYILNNDDDKQHKCLVFSHSKVVLSIIERVLMANLIDFLRLDGDVATTTERQSLVDEFNNDNSKSRVMLLTSQVGGVGLTLTGADRVIICDLSWNPAIDAQAVDRVYRIGQKREVVIYRLVTCGTVEEKIYRRQIYKEGLNRQTTGVTESDDDPYRHFTHGDLLDLFELENPEMSQTQQQLQQLEQTSHQNYQQPYSDLIDNEVKWLKQQPGVIYGVSKHDLLFVEPDKQVQSTNKDSDKLVDLIANSAKVKLETNISDLQNVLSIKQEKSHAIKYHDVKPNVTYNSQTFSGSCSQLLQNNLKVEVFNATQSIAEPEICVDVELDIIRDELKQHIKRDDYYDTKNDSYNLTDELFSSPNDSANPYKSVSSSAVLWDSEPNYKCKRKFHETSELPIISTKVNKKIDIEQNPFFFN